MANRNRKISGLFCASIALALAPVASAESEFGIDTGLSTLGITITPGYRLNEMIGFRAPLGYMVLGHEFDEDGTTVKGKAFTGGIGALVDYYPMDNGFRMTGGAMLPLYKIIAQSDGASTEIDGIEYAVSDLDARVNSAGIAPYVGLGYQFRSGAQGWSAAIDLGALFNVGYEHSYSYTADGLLAIDPTGEAKAEFDRAVDDAAADLQAELEEAGDILPFISISATYRF